MSVARNTRKPDGVKADLAQRKVAAEARAKAQIEVLMAEIVIRRCRDTAEALERLQMRSAPLGFFTLSDLMAPQPWAILDGVVLGHLLTMEEGAYLAAINADAFDAPSLDEVMRMAWCNASEFEAWAGIYTKVLQALAEQTENDARSFREQDELKKAGAGFTGGATGRRGGL